jgi:hypothetical protein
MIHLNYNVYENVSPVGVGWNFFFGILCNVGGRKIAFEVTPVDVGVLFDEA